MSENLDRINPIRLTDKNGIIKNAGDVYELDFSRESVVFAEKNEFDLKNAIKFPVTGFSNLFYYSFRKNHRSIARDKTDKFMKEVWGGGLPENVIERLIDLYDQAQTANAIVLDEDAGKNEMVTVEM